MSKERRYVVIQARFKLYDVLEGAPGWSIWIDFDLANIRRVKSKLTRMIFAERARAKKFDLQPMIQFRVSRVATPSQIRGLDSSDAPSSRPDRASCTEPGSPRSIGNPSPSDEVDRICAGQDQTPDTDGIREGVIPTHVCPLTPP